MLPALLGTCSEAWPKLRPNDTLQIRLNYRSSAGILKKLALISGALVLLSLLLATFLSASSSYSPHADAPVIDPWKSTLTPANSMRVIQRSAGETQLPGYTRFVCLSDTHGLHRDSSLLKVRPIEQSHTLLQGGGVCTYQDLSAKHRGCRAPTHGDQFAGAKWRHPRVCWGCWNRFRAAGACICNMAG